MPLVSVIIPTYNRSQSLKRAIKSVLAQTFQDYELIIVDDYSSDDTKIIVDDFKDKRIKYIQLSKNTGGALIPRIKGFIASSGKYIAPLDDDDYWYDVSKLELQVRYLEKYPKCVLVGTNAIGISQDKEVAVKHCYLENDNQIREKILYRNWYYHSSVVYRRETLLTVGGYQKVDVGIYNNMVNEYQLWLRMGLVGEFINLPIYGVAYDYMPNELKYNTKIAFMRCNLKTIKAFRKSYPHYLKACIYQFIITYLDIPVLSWAKRMIRGY